MTLSDNDDDCAMSIVSQIRKRPAMYLGGTCFFGFIQYVVSAFDLLLEHGATLIEFQVGESFRISSNARIPTDVSESGGLVQFETLGKLKPHHLPVAAILVALSDWLQVILSDGITRTELKTSKGERISFLQVPANESKTVVALQFRPDPEIFSVLSVSPAVVHSYCKRIACLHRGVTFRVKIDNDVTEYHSANGIRDLFNAVTTTYQILNEPICIDESEEDLSVEAVFAFQSWSETQIWSYVNKGRVPDGGTHEAGFLNAIRYLKSPIPDRKVGLLAVLSVDYPHVTYEGCIKERIGNPELFDKVSALITRGLESWARENEDENEHLKKIERFQFGSIW